MPLIDAIQRDPAFARLKAMVIAATGLAYYSDKDAAFAERVARRLPRDEGLALDAYLARLEGEGTSGAEFQALINELTVGETFFFRYLEQFEALCAVAIPECLRRNQGSRLLRIWSAGCSIGAEAYTMEILLHRHFAEQLKGWQVHILGTDINRTFIEQARRATYGDWAVRGLSAETLETNFVRHGKQWQVKPELRQWTSFTVFNLVDGPIPSYPHGIGLFDIVLCRNVMIYFDEATRSRLLGNLQASLAVGGWLVVGHAEAGPQMNELFTSVPVPGATLYRRHLPAAAPAAKPAASPTDRAASRPSATLRSDTSAPRRKATARKPADEDRKPQAPPAEVPPAEVPPAKGPPAKGPPADERSSALESCLARVERNRMDPAAHYQLGLIEEELGVGDPVAAFKRALYLDPAFALADYQLALAYWRRGRLGPAQRHFRNARDAIAEQPEDEAVSEGGGLSVGELRGMVDLWLSGEEA